MKAKHVLIAIAALFIIESVNQNVTMDPVLFSTIEDMLNILLGICLILLVYMIIRQIVARPEPSSKQIQKPTKTMDDINKELDEIESSLNAITDNKKVTPFWEISTKKK